MWEPGTRGPQAPWFQAGYPWVHGPPGPLSILGKFRRVEEVGVIKRKRVRVQIGAPKNRPRFGQSLDPRLSLFLERFQGLPFALKSPKFRPSFGFNSLQAWPQVFLEFLKMEAMEVGHNIILIPKEKSKIMSPRKTGPETTVDNIDELFGSPWMSYLARGSFISSLLCMQIILYVHMYMHMFTILPPILSHFGQGSGPRV